MKTNTSNSASALDITGTLLPNHLVDLQASGLGPQTINSWGCYSVLSGQDSLLQDLGFGHLDLPALALPALPPDREKPDLHDVILKPDRPRIDDRGRPRKYEVRPRARNR